MYFGLGIIWEDCDKYVCCGNFGELKWLKVKYFYLKIIIFVGGWIWFNCFFDMVVDEKIRKVFVEFIVVFFCVYGFDGVDLDWEYLGVEMIFGGSYCFEDK